MNDDATTRSNGTSGRAAAKRWTFTVNNPELEGDEPAWLERLDAHVTNGIFTYYVAGWEIGDGGTPHIQGYVELAKRSRISSLKSLISGRAHFEISRGTAKQASDYCKKDGSFAESGVISCETSRQGRRTDLEAVKEKLDNGICMADIADSHFEEWLKFNKAFNHYRLLRAPRREWVTEVIVYYGPTGTGKTRKVHEEEKDLWVATDNTLKWFDGYENHEAVLFDDFVSIKNTKFGFLLQLLDRYGMHVPVKGGFVNWAPKRIYFTSNLPVEEWFTGVTHQQFQALKRRITKSVQFHGARYSEEGNFSHFT